MPSSHLILCCPLLLLPSIFPTIRVFSSESALRIRWPNYWSFNINPSNEYSGLISFRIDWFDLLVVQGTPKSLQHHSSKALILRCSAFFMVQLLHPYGCPWDSPGENTGVGCHFLLQCMKVKSESEVAQSCLTRSDPMDCSPPGSSIHGIFQAKVLEWGAIAFSSPITSWQIDGETMETVTDFTLPASGSFPMSQLFT